MTRSDIEHLLSNTSWQDITRRNPSPQAEDLSLGIDGSRLQLLFREENGRLCVHNS
jgi:hypothetical protein